MGARVDVQRYDYTRGCSRTCVFDDAISLGEKNSQWDGYGQSDDDEDKSNR